MILVMALAFVGCGDDAPRSGDADVLDVTTDVETPIALAAPMAPALPMLPNMAPCPAGWAEATTPEGFTYCDPYPEGVLDCEAATMQLPGRRTCERVGATCPIGDLPEGLPSDRAILYVLAGGTGDGSRERPFGTLADAIAAAPDGAIVAIGKGRYVERVVLERSIEIRGACPAETVLVWDALLEGPIAVLGEADVDVRDLGIEAPRGPGLHLRDGASARVHDLVIGPSRSGVVAYYSHLEVEHVLLRDVAGGEMIGGGSLVSCILGECSVRDLVAVGTVAGGIHGATASLSVEQVAVLPDGEGFGIGLAAGGGETTAREVVIVGMKQGVHHTGGSLELDRVMIAGCRDPGIESSTASTGRAEISVARTVIDGTVGVAMGVGRADAVLTDVIARRVAVTVLDELSSGLVVSQDGSVQLERVAIGATDSLGIASYDLARVRGHDVTIADIRAGGGTGAGVGLATNGSVELARLHVRGAEGAGAMVLGGEVHLEDVTIDSPAAESALGIGLAVVGGEAQVARARLIGNRTASIVVAGAGARLVGGDVTVEETLPNATSGDLGRGIEASDGGFIELVRVRVAQSRDHGVVAYDRAELHLADVAIDDTRERACAESTCSAHPGGIGVGAYRSTIALERFSIGNAVLCGVHLDATSQGALTAGRLTGNHVAVCLSGDHDLAALTDRVTLEGNGENLNAVELPLPSPLPPLPSVGDRNDP